MCKIHYNMVPNVAHGTERVKIKFIWGGMATCSTNAEEVASFVQASPRYAKTKTYICSSVMLDAVDLLESSK